jgi:adenosine/AMP kinase
MDISAVALQFPADCNVIVGQSHFIKTVEDVAEIVATIAPAAKFGLAFCEASGPCLIRREGNDPELVDVAVAQAQAVGAGHTFFLVLRGMFPISVLPAIKHCQEVCRVFCATANPLQVLVATNAQGRGILGVIDGSSPRGVESDAEVESRRAFLRTIGYKR